MNNELDPRIQRKPAAEDNKQFFTYLAPAGIIGAVILIATWPGAGAKIGNAFSDKPDTASASDVPAEVRPSQQSESPTTTVEEEAAPIYEESSRNYRDYGRPEEILPPGDHLP